MKISTVVVGLLLSIAVATPAMASSWERQQQDQVHHFQSIAGFCEMQLGYPVGPLSLLRQEVVTVQQSGARTVRLVSDRKAQDRVLRCMRVFENAGK